MSIGFWQIAIVVVLVVLLFGRGKISDLMGDVAKGIKSFKKGMKDPTEPVSSGDKSTEPVSSGDKSTEPVSSEDKSTEDTNPDKK